jgi:DNA polymerase-3 subunit epsilon
VRFDRQFLECEFTRIGYAFPDCYALCTLQLAGGKLVDCCRDFGVPLDDAHQALADARAAAGLLVCLLREASDRREVLTRLPPISWPALTMEGKPPYPRSEARRRWAEPPGYVARLLTLVRGRPAAMELPEAALAYRELLDRVLEDRRVEDAEADALVEIAQRWGLAGQEIDQFHRKYLDALAAAAVADGTVSNSEQRDLAHVARLLGLQGVDLGAVLDQAARTAAAQNIPAPSCEARPIGGSVESLAGQTVCFTGELQCSICGELITREQAEEFARNAGLKTAGSVTKALNILVVADPNTQSGKAKKARQYGVRVLHEPVFWKSLGISVE